MSPKDQQTVTAESLVAALKMYRVPQYQHTTLLFDYQLYKAMGILLLLSKTIEVRPLPPTPTPTPEKKNFLACDWQQNNW